MYSFILVVLLALVPGFGCYRQDQIQQLRRCESICTEPANVCSEFIYDDCLIGCMDKTGTDFIDVFEMCVDCYTSVQCDAVSFTARCTGSCTL